MKKLLLWVALALMSCTIGMKAQNYAWPENYTGVMLQGFWWDSFQETKWTTLESQADELSKYFSLIWIPNSARDNRGGGQSMGYLPVYWFSNYNTCFGTEAQLRSMIKTFKAKGTGIIADVVVNHRVGVTSWMDFPRETWRGETYQLGPEHVCNTDEVNNAGNPGGATGAKDSGTDFNGGRDLDHSSPEVQRNCQAYCQFLLEEMGFAGFRYDMVLGYSAKYTRQYNEYAKPTFSVGEYWINNYSSVKSWINGTGKQSAAFDFPQKADLNAAFTAGYMTRLVRNGTLGKQPIGLAADGYGQYAVTFIDNHDTYRDVATRFPNNVPAANAFILCSPGTPCVFLAHWKQYPNTIKQLINIRKAVGVHNMSKVTVLRSEKDVYLGKVEGLNGELVVKIGKADVTPDGYTDADLVISGYEFAVWTKTPVEKITEQDEPYVPVTHQTEILVRNTVGWGYVNAYAWNEQATNLTGAWPGERLTETRTINNEEWLYASYPVDKVNLVLSSGTGNPQTIDVNGISGRKFLEITNERQSGKYVVKTLDLVEDFENTGDDLCIHVVDSRGWGRMFIHASNANDGELFGAFPGVEMTDRVTIDGKEFYRIKFPSRYSVNLIFSDGESTRTAVANQVLGTVYYTISGAKNKEGHHYLTRVEVSGVEGVSVDNAPVATEYFDLQGRRVLIIPAGQDEAPALRPGVYIVRQGSKVSKQLVR